MMKPFLGRDFTPLQLEHRDRLTPILKAHPQPISGYTFAMLLAWNQVFHYRWTVLDSGTLLVSCHPQPNSKPQLLMPVGEPSAEEIRALMEEISRLDYRLHIHGLTEQFLARHPTLTAAFDVEDDPGGANYIYLASDLADLPGRRYHKKRNLIAQAQQAYAWTVEPVTAATVRACRDVVQGLETVQDHAGKQQELMVLGHVLDHLPDLELEGLLVRVEGKPVAFSLFEPLTADTAVVHFEKAVGLKGLYQVVNRETARVLRDRGCTFINREEDANDPGLRHAKESYHPVRLCRQLTLGYRGRPAERAGRALAHAVTPRECCPPMHL